MDELELFGRLGWRRPPAGTEPAAGGAHPSGRGGDPGAGASAPHPHDPQNPQNPQWRWEQLNEISAQIEATRHSPLAARQALRIERFKLAGLAMLLELAVFLSFVVVDKLPLAVYLGIVAGSAAFAGVFYWTFKSGLNLRFRDPSLTAPMMTWAVVVMLYAMAGARGSYELISILYLLPFFFGTLRLRTGPMLALAGILLACDFAIMALTPSRVATSDLWRVEFLRWITLAIVLTWFAFMGGFLSDMRSRLNTASRNLMQAFEAIRHLAAHDELTGVYNRRQMVEVVRAERSRADRYGTPWSVCLIDIDFFKRVNDTFGHAAGDIVLQEFAQALERGKRPTDHFGRYGGEEFILVLAQTRLDQARLAAERVRQLAEGLRFTSLGPSMRITVSLGVAEYRHNEDWQATVQRADEALYAAKQNGRNRVEVAPTPEEPRSAKPPRGTREPAADLVG